MASSAAPGTRIGEAMHALATRLWPLNRSITGEGVRQTLAIIGELVPALVVHEVTTGTPCFDWVVPREWVIREAYIECPDGGRIAEFARNNLHVVGYSVPVNAEFDLDELQDHLHSLPGQPDAVPYVTSYYEERWGFCLSHRQREGLRPGRYRAVIDSELVQGSLTYADVIVPGESPDEVLLSTYVCHPSMANNELSGPCVAAYLCRYLLSLSRRRYTYRVVFVPETIGSIVYLSRNLAALKERTVAGYVLTCVGDERAYSLIPSRLGNTLSDVVARHVLGNLAPDYVRYTFLDRGSDERQYCSPGVDLPVASVMRTRYGDYPEYHTSLDDLALVTPTGLEGAYNAYRCIIECLEGNCYPAVTGLCEPHLGPRGLYPTLSTRTSGDAVVPMMDLIAYSDGSRSLLDIAELIGEPMWELMPIVETLRAEGLLVTYDRPAPQYRPDGNWSR